jgi:outer membrane protein assembly complex protein YaeT
LLLAGCNVRTNGATLYPQVAAQTGKQIRSVRFVGNEPFSSDTLAKIIETKPRRCSILGAPICIGQLGLQQHRLDPETVRRDIQKLMLFYRAEGYFGTSVAPSVEAVGAEEVRITFAVARGEAIILDALDVSGTEGIMDPDSLARTLPLKPGQLFDLGKFVGSADAVLNALHTRGHAYAEILRNYSVDTVDNRAVASLQAIPGPRVVVDSIIVVGAEHLGRANTIRQLTFRPGDILQVSALAQSQVNLYGLELVQIASVNVAPDSVQKPPPNDSTTATVMVTVAEAPLHQADVAIGFGTVECLRTDASLLNRSFGGGARRLSLAGSVSKIGLAGRTESGIGKSLCHAFSTDSAIRSKIDYRFSADLTQPYFLSPKNQVTAGVFDERQSEPGIFLREAKGGRLAMSRRIGRRSVATAAFDVERASTVASPALYCAAFLVCEIGFTDSLALPRFRDAVSLSATHDRTDSPLDPSNGWNATSTLTWAAKQLGSEIRFVRWTGQAAYYHELQPGWVVTLGARFGNFFRSATLDPTRNFLPPQERFFAGGTNSVRGFDRNALGQGVYRTNKLVLDTLTHELTPVDPVFVATGGTALAVTSAELRFPSPFLSEFVRLALFVDAGSVGTRSVWDLSPTDWKVTPGAGLRLATPVGPVRVDVAYNPYGLNTAPLLFANTDAKTLTRVRDDYRPGGNSIFNRFHITLGIGQAY